MLVGIVPDVPNIRSIPVMRVQRFRMLEEKGEYSAVSFHMNLRHRRIRSLRQVTICFLLITNFKVFVPITESASALIFLSG